jgi:hypothetical protein
MKRVLSCVLALIFAWAAYGKFQDLEAFTVALKSIQMGVSGPVLPYLTRIVPWTEAVVALGLLSPIRRGAALLGATVLCVFSCVVVALMRSGLSVECPCFGSYEFLCTGPLGACHLVRNLILLGLCLILVIPWGRVDRRVAIP